MYDIIKEGSFKGYINIIATVKWWEPYTKKLKYCSSAKFDEQNNKFSKGWSPCSELMLGTSTFTLPTLKIDVSDHPFIKYDIFEVHINYLPRCTPIGIVSHYCEYHNMSYISELTNNTPWIMPSQKETRLMFVSSSLS